MDNFCYVVAYSDINLELSGRKWDKEKLCLLASIHTRRTTKKRISLPAKFRKELGSKIVVTRGLDNCLFLFTTKAWNSIADKTSSLGMMQADTRGLTRYFFSGASEVEVDSAGRILIPDYLSKYAEIENKAVFAGVHDRIEIWNEKRWVNYKAHIEKDAENMAEKLSSVGMI